MHPCLRRGGELRTVLLAIGLSMAGQASAVADDPQPANELLVVDCERNGAIWLVHMPGVAQELRLSREQVEQTQQWRRELEAEHRKLLRPLIGGQGPDHERRREQRQEQARQITRGYNRRVVDLLDDRQAARLNELYVRLLGPRALYIDRVADYLQLQLEQRARLRRAAEQPDTDVTELLEILTPEQLVRFGQMQGQPFAFPQPKFIRLIPD